MPIGTASEHMATGEGNTSTESIDGYRLRIEDYDTYVACTVFGDITASEVAAMGNALYGRTYVLLQTPPHMYPRPTIWGLARRGISQDDAFIRFDGVFPQSHALTYEFSEDGESEVGIISKDVDVVVRALNEILPREIDI